MNRSSGRSLRDRVSRLLPGGDAGVDLDAAADTGGRTLGSSTLAELGLAQQPFLDQARPNELFTDHAIDMQINTLAEQLRSGNMIPVLKGEPGAGKTSMLIQLMSRHGDDYHFFVVRGRDALSAEATIVDMLRALVEPVPDDPADCFRELARRLRALVADGHPAVLVVDDADDLPDAELNHLFAAHDSLTDAVGGHFRILFTTGPAFELRVANLQSRQIDAGHIVATGIRPLQGGRVGPYLYRRLQGGGLQGPLPFDDDDLDRIAAAGQGIPRRIEAAAAALLDERLG